MEQILVQFQAEISNLMPLCFVTGENRRQPFSGRQPVYKLSVTNRFFVGAMPVSIITYNHIPVFLAFQAAALNQELHLPINNCIYIVMECQHGTDFPEWEEQPFEKIFEPLNNNTFSRDLLNYTAGPALNIHYGDILVKYGDVCDVDKDVLPFVNDGQDVTKYAFLRDGDIVLADTAEDEAVGKTIEVINTHDRIIVSGLHTMACRPRIVFSLKYLGYYMNSPEFHDQLRPYIQGIKVSSIGRKNISGVLVKYPSDLVEQRLIADFLSDFDEAITAAKKELQLWKELKKGLLQQMFV